MKFCQSKWNNICDTAFKNQVYPETSDKVVDHKKFGEINMVKNKRRPKLDANRNLKAPVKVSCKFAIRLGL